MSNDEGDGSATADGRRSRLWKFVVSGVAVAAASAVAIVVLVTGTDDEPGGAIRDIDDVRDATVRIASEGGFPDPAGGASGIAGSGSGFLVSPDGLIVTNNHVVAGADSVDVFVPGRERPYDARVLGLSECTDLAVVDIGGEGHPFVAWTRAAPSTGLDVFALGYPLDAPEPVQRRGVVSVARATGDLEWASVDNTLAHTAAVEPGEWGGPLALSDGRILGVNYPPTAAGERLALAHVEARGVVEILAQGEALDSIGVNGQAVVDDVSRVSGIWVTAVASRSPAARTGIVAGDLITRIEGVSLAADGTMAQYCDVLRSHDEDAVLAVEVVRSETEEVLEGQINGAALEPSFSFAQELGDLFAEPAPDVPDVYREFVAVSDDTGTFSVEVPVEWAEVDGRALVVDGGTSRPNVRVAASLEGFETSFSVPGANVSYFEDAGADDAVSLLDEPSGALLASCAEVTRRPYEDARWRGSFDEYTGCGDRNTSVVVVAAGPTDGDYLVRVLIQVVTRADLGALDTILDTVVVRGAPDA